MILIIFFGILSLLMFWVQSRFPKWEALYSEHGYDMYYDVNSIKVSPYHSDQRNVTYVENAFIKEMYVHGSFLTDATIDCSNNTIRHDYYLITNDLYGKGGPGPLYYDEIENPRPRIRNESKPFFVPKKDNIDDGYAFPLIEIVCNHD